MGAPESDTATSAAGKAQPVPGFIRRHLDPIEKGILIVLFLYFVHNQLQSALVTPSLLNLILVMGEASVLVFVLLRRRTDAISQRPLDWAVGFLGTCLPLFAMPSAGGALMPVWLCGIVMLTGFVVQMSAKLTLRRSFGVVAANRGVKVSGPYALVRHPMYAGYVMTQAGFLLSAPTIINCVIYATAFFFQLIRIEAEERVLGEDPSYREFMTRTRYRLVPGLY